MEQLKVFAKISLIRYLDSDGIMKTMENLLIQYQQQLYQGEIDLHTPFHCPVFINIVKLNDISGYTCRLLLSEPNFMQEMVREIILTAATSLLQSKKKIQSAQITCPIILSFHHNILPTVSVQGLRSWGGVVVEHTLPTKYIRTSRWKCPQSICESLGPILRRKIPKIVPLCLHCSGPLDEDPTKRDHGSSIEVKIMEHHHLQFASRNLGEWIFCRAEDERQCNVDISLGSEIMIAGIKDDSAIEVWGFDKMQHKMLEADSNSLIEQLRRRHRDSPWAFVQELSKCIGKNLYPDDAFANLRIGLLLSLASVNSASPIPILAVCEDTNVAQKLMKEAASLARRCVKPCLPTNLGGYIKDGWRCCGSMLLASGGICYLGHWEPYVGNRGQPVRNAIESGRIVLLNGDGEHLPLKASVWTYWDQPSKKKHEDQLDTLLKVFGFSWNTAVDTSLEESVVDCILNSNLLRNTYIRMEELRSYIETVNLLTVTLSDGALDLLTKYFVCSRRARGENLGLRSLNPLIALTEAHARLNQRPIAYPEDALAALELCEYALGPCNIYPPPPKDTWEFGNWLQQYVLSLGNPSVSQVLSGSYQTPR